MWNKYILRSVAISGAMFALSFFISVPTAHAAVRTASVSGNWSDTATWGGLSVPVMGDAVTINDGINVTVDTAAACDSLIFIATNASNAVTISGSNSLTITNALTLPRPNGVLQTETVAVGSGTLSAGSISLGGTGSSRNTSLTISTGTVTVSGNITSAGTASQIIFSGAGTLNAGGTFLSGITGTFVAGNGTVNFNAAGPQTVAPFAYTFNNLTLSGSGIKTTTNTTVNGVLSMEGTATASAAPTYGASATLKYNTATSRNAGAEWISPFAAGGGVVIANTGTITMNAAKIIGVTSLLTVNSGATLSMSTFLLTLNSDFVNNGGTLSGTTGGVTIAGTADQSIGAFTTTGIVSMTKTAGTATFAGNVNGAGLTINGIGGTLNLGVGLTHTFTSTWTRTNGTLNGGSSTLKFGAGFSGTGGTFTANTGKVEWNANGIQTFPALTYNNLTLSGTSVKTVATTPTVNGVLSMEGTATITVTTGVVTYGAGATLQYNTPSVRTVSSEEWVNPFTATGGVIIKNTGIIVMDTAKVFNDSVPLTINSGATLATNNFQLTLGGNFVNSGGTFNAGSSNIIIGPGAATQSISGFTTTGGVTCSKSGGIATLTGNMNASSLTNSTAGGTLNLGAGLTHTITGAWTRTDGTLDGGSSILNIGGTVINTAGTFTAGISTVNYYGAGAQTTADVNYYNLTLSGSGAKTLPATNIDIYRDFINNSASVTTIGNTITLNGTSAQTIGGSASTTFNNLTINNTSGITASINTSVNGTLNLQSANPSATTGSLDMGANTLTMGGSATTIGAGDVTGIVRRTTLVANTSYTFGNQYTTINFRNIGTLPTDMSLRIAIGSAPAWKLDAVKRTYEGIKTGGIGSFAVVNFHYLDSELNGNTENRLVKWASVSPFTTATEDGRSNYDVTNNWVGTSAFDISLLPTSFGSREATLAVTAISGVTWNGSISTDWMVPCNWTSTPGSLCGVPSDLADVTIPDASTTPNDPILNPALAVGRLTLESGAILNTAAGYASTVTISGANGAWSDSGGTFNAGTGATGSTIIFTNAATTISGDTDFYNVTIDPGAELVMGSNSAMRISGTMTNNGNWRTVIGGHTDVEYKGGAQTVVVPNIATNRYYCLILSGTGTKTMPVTPLEIIQDFTVTGTASVTAGAALTVGGNFTLDAGATFDASTFTHNVAGDWINNGGTFTNTGSTINLDGSSAQAIGGSAATTFNNLTINNSAGATLSSVSPTIDGVLTLTSGNITTGANTLIISPTGSVSGGSISSYVIGNLQKNIAIGVAVLSTFEIGTTNYHPVTVTFGNVTGAGNLTAKSTTGDHPDIINSTIAPTKTVNTYWTLTDGGITFDNYSAVFDFVAGDLDGTADPSNFIVGKYNAGWTYPTVGIKNLTDTQITGETSFSEFQLGNTSADIAAAGVTGFVAPVTGAVPQAFGTLTPDAAAYAVTGLTWAPVHNPYQAVTAYTATVTLTSAAGYKFPVAGIAVPTADFGTVNSVGTTAGGDVSGNTLSFTVLFPATVAPSSDATLSNITISAGTLSPVFLSATISYTDSVTNGTASVTVTPTANDAGATITVNSAPVVSGAASGAIALSVGLNTITVLVTAQDAVTTKTYTIAVTRASAGGGGSGGGNTDITPPTNTSVTINSAATSTATTAVTLTLAATDAAQMLISNYSDFSGAAWENYTAAKSWTLLSGAGTKTVYVKFRDVLNNTSNAVSGTIILVYSPLTEPPSAGYSCPTLTAGDMVKVVGKSAIYALNNSLQTLYFPSGDEFKSWRPTYGGYISISQSCFDTLSVPSAYPGAVNYRPGSYIVKRPSSDQLYVVEPNNTLAKITPSAATELYGIDYKIMTVADVFWPHYINRGADITTATPHPGMLIKVDGTTYYVDMGNILREVTSAGMTANGFQTRFVRVLSNTVIDGWVKGNQLETAESVITNKTQ